tara:strand:+ start:193 stop:372 length:180 start_codon:yes stop_codon:yes gene_type:complete
MKNYTRIWLFLSSFGIMFAVFSWIQDSNIISQYIISGYKKGLFALITGILLYKYVAKKA